MLVLEERKKSEGDFKPMADDDLIICRCEEITKGEIRRAIYDGMWTITELRRYLRAGMGLCQGQTCEKLVKGILAKERGQGVDTISPSTGRGPMRPVELSVYANEVGGVDHE